MDWIHCNKCTAIGNRGGSYWFTSCGHIVCTNCMKQGGPSPGHKGSCLVCQKPASIIEINRSMKPEILALFKPPREMLVESTQRMKATLDLQNNHRQMLVKKLYERYERASKYARGAQAEIARRDEREKALVTEKDQLKTELDMATDQIRQLEHKLREREHEIHRLRKSPQRRKRNIYPSLNGNTPITSLSFLGCGAMSTPVESGGLNFNVVPETQLNFGIRTEQHKVETNIEALFRSPNAQEETPIAGPAFCPTTPYLFAMAGSSNNEKHASATPKYF